MYSSNISFFIFELNLTLSVSNMDTLNMFGQITGERNFILHAFHSVYQKQTGIYFPPTFQVLNVRYWQEVLKNVHQILSFD